VRAAQLPLLLLVLIALAGRTRSQVYFPETDHHDPVQRVFPVECTRVLLALAAEGGLAKATEILPEVTARNGTHAWKIVLKDAAGGTVQTVQISYPDKQLLSGAAHYRAVALDIARQLKIPRPKEPGTAETFWRGATLTQPSREASLNEAFTTAATLQTARSANSMMRLAGLLAHATLPAQAGQVSLDPLLLARSATLLAYAESEGAPEATWAPLLFQSGRSGTAEQAWKNRPASWTNTPYARSWETWLGRPSTQQIYLAACDAESYPMGIAMLYFDGVRDQTWPLMEDLLPHFVKTRERLAMLHNYGPISAAAGSIGMGHQFAASGILQRNDWIRLLDDWAVDAELPGIAALVDASQKKLQSEFTRKQNDEPSVIGLKVLAELYRKAEQESRGPLRPVIVASTQDLLAYGWEMAGWQLGARFRFLNNRFGSPPDAKPVITAAQSITTGWSPFLSAVTTPAKDRIDALFRLQHVTEVSRFANTALHPYMPPSNAADPAAAAMFVRRTWLQIPCAGWHAHAIAAATNGKEVTKVLQQFVEEGGPIANDSVLDFLSARNQETLDNSPGLSELRIRLARAARQPTATTLRVLREDVGGYHRTLENAQALERLYWRNTDSRIENNVFIAYASAGYPTEAKRFYMRVRSQLGDPVAVSNGIGKSAWMVGMCTDDVELRRAALEDSRSASFSDLNLHAWEAGITGDASDVEKALDELIGRYSRSAASFTSIRSFLPLLPALKDPKHPKHPEALDFFGKQGHGTVFRWIWIKRCKLSPEDGIRLLGGTDAEDERAVLVQLLRKDIKAARKALDAAKISAGERSLMVSLLYHQADPSFRSDAKPEDVRPAGMRFTREVVAERLGLSDRSRRKP
jgi:hypothetical protein